MKSDRSEFLGRRAFLLRSMSAALAAGYAWNHPALASLFGQIPGRLPDDRSVFDWRGEVLINGNAVARETAIGPGDYIEVGSNSYLIAAVGDSAFMLRENSRLDLEGAGRALVRSMQLVTGALLSVFGPRQADTAAQLRTDSASIGIRGTGVYAEAHPDRTYLCTCYGTTDLTAIGDPKSREQITAQYHDAPRYILKAAEQGRHIIPAPFINHTDMELMTLEALVGRTVPFQVPDTLYEGPRRDY